MANTAKKISQRLSKNIKLYRKNAGLTQVQLGLAAGLGEDYLAHIEQEKNFPSIKALCKIADILNIDPVELLKP